MTEIIKSAALVRLSAAAAIADAASAAQRPPPGASCVSDGSQLTYYVPVSFVAKDWKVTPRRIRVLLREGRLRGRLLHNGYWEVSYPYLYQFGTRGPALKRSQKQERSTL